MTRAAAQKTTRTSAANKKEAPTAAPSLFEQITQLNLEIRSLNRQLASPITEFDAWDDYLVYLDSEFEALEFHGVLLSARSLAGFTKTSKGSTLDADYHHWLSTQAIKEELSVYKVLYAKMDKARQQLAQCLDQAESQQGA